MAPSTIGTFLGSFTFGHIRQLEAVIGRAPERAGKLGVGRGAAPLVIDIDSTICEVAGKAKGGAGYGHTKVLGLYLDPPEPAVARGSEAGSVASALHTDVGVITRVKRGRAALDRVTESVTDH